MSNRSIVIGFKELNWTVAGHHLGVRPDVEPVVDEAFKLGRDGNLFRGSRSSSSSPSTATSHEVHAPGFDPVAMDAFMQALAGAVDRPTTDASLALAPEGTRRSTSKARPGASSRSTRPSSRLEEALARPEVSYVELADRRAARRRVGAEISRPAKAQADALLSAPLLLKFEELHWELTPKQLVSMATVSGTQGVRVDRDDGQDLGHQDLAKEVEQDPENARFTWQNGVLSLLRESKDGRQLDVEKTVDLVMAKALTTDRTVTLPVSVTKPEVSQDDADKLKIEGAIEVARTSFAGSSPPKQHNIGLATQRLNGVVVPPGKMFSFNKEVGSTSLDAGYKLGWGIANAGGTNVKTVPSVAGGICQVATTLFHSVFWAGYQIEERNYHLYWITGYTSQGVEGLDATVDEEAGPRLPLHQQHRELPADPVLGRGRPRSCSGCTAPSRTGTSRSSRASAPTCRRPARTRSSRTSRRCRPASGSPSKARWTGSRSPTPATVTKAGEEPRILAADTASTGRRGTSCWSAPAGARPARHRSSRTGRRPAAAQKPRRTARTLPPAAGRLPRSRRRPPPTSAPAAKPSTTQPAPASKPSTQPAPATKPIVSPLFPTNPVAPGTAAVSSRRSALAGARASEALRAVSRGCGRSRRSAARIGPSSNASAVSAALAVSSNRRISP